MIPYSMDDASVGTWFFIVTVGVTALVGMLNQIALFFYWKPSRMIFLFTCLPLYLSTLLFGLSVLSPLEYLLYELSAFISGISVALAFYSPVAQKFSVDPQVEYGDGVA